ncbi:hypothetical protein [Piscirickettsia litoralis]|uniref:Major facilitator superfamily (MFS) profile domain-containing protein n=1 Tax=Piscirickettsia litoralis TaxID=1891921 RepID=A0ABX2ZY52_9GAMM|nr:hypothetical protein [Piscirickettsia litoralis]ODN40942.1 hypothetical protein BGC07_18950 [Piscirickettsia litoralis]
MIQWKKYIAGCALGNTLELYDFILYGYFSYIIADQFFPKSVQTIAILLSFSVFASGCLVRPLGAILA